MSGSVIFGRKKPVPICPNSLFLKWLTEWRDEAAEKGKKTQFVYQKAISSLKRYPLPLQNGRDAKILQNFGDGICKMLDEKLEKYYARYGTDAPIHSLICSELEEMSTSKKKRKPVPLKNCSGDLLPQEMAMQEKGSETLSPSLSKKKKAKEKQTRRYVPQKSSGGYAVLLTLYRDSKSFTSRGYMLKSELQRAAQPLCDKSFFLPDDKSRYTAWSSVSTLIQKDLIVKTHNPARESDVSQGQNQDPVLGNDEQRPHNHIPEFILHPGQFSIVLCIDFIETTGGSNHRKQELVRELKKNGVRFDVRKLHIGDFVWIAQEQVQVVPGEPLAPRARELVLDHVVERKRMDDLCNSIIDGRFREQKFRLKRCGLQCPIYLVEDYGTSQHLSIPEATLEQAIVNTQVVDGFFIKRTKDIQESAAYLTLMSHHLQRLYKNKTLLGCTKEEASKCRQAFMPTADSCILMTFGEFNEGAIKNKAQTVREVFARQLMQISGISGEKAAAILEHYSTLASLLEAYNRCSSVQDQEKLLFNVKCGKLQRNLGPVLSKTISQLYCTAGALT
uniref:Crossover junction endonuclease MUS81 n=1 Tax=Geotrypetes seraphini TaxID=260995 RepID=A0A6P8RV63_GEOSA|nr:crossover junction endonuclease MUS81 isoform X2 [Geotrypetes seraphini]